MENADQFPAQSSYTENLNRDDIAPCMQILCNQLCSEYVTKQQITNYSKELVPV